MYNRLLAAMVCGLSLALLGPILSDFALTGAPVAAIVQLVGGVIAIISASLLLRAVLRQSNVTQ